MGDMQATHAANGSVSARMQSMTATSVVKTRGANAMTPALAAAQPAPAST